MTFSQDDFQLHKGQYLESDNFENLDLDPDNFENLDLDPDNFENLRII
jgi:hypothetical protein